MKRFITLFLAFCILSLNFAFADTSTTTLNSSYKPTCAINKREVAPNEPVVFAPYAPFASTGEVFTYRWVGEASTTSKGDIKMAFINPGVYTIVLQAMSPDRGSVFQVNCPAVTVSLNHGTTTYSYSGSFYPYPFTSTSTRALIPNETQDLPKGCMSIGEDLSYGYFDATKNPKDGTIYALQQFLINHKYLSGGATGYFGNLTRIAVKKFQKDYGINQTGYVGKVTRAKITSISCQNL